MISEAQNDRLTRVEGDAPMGQLLRRYWQPVGASAEIRERPTKAIRLFGEELVLYRDKSGKLGCVDRYCAHRRFSLVYGIPEEHGIRCPYHGWCYDETGQCTEQP